MVIVTRYQPQVVTQPGKVVPVQASQSAAGGLAAGLSDVGDMFADWQDEVDTARAKEADASFTEQVNDLLYNEQSGYMYTQGGAAVEGYQSVSDRANALYEETLSGLDGAARAKAATALRARLGGTTTRINGHAAQARIGYLNQATDARVGASINAAIYDPASRDAEIANITRENREAAARSGWAPEALAQKQQEDLDRLHEGIVDRLASVDPTQAMTYLADNRDQISGTLLTRLETKLLPVAKEYRGRQVGRQAALSRPVLDTQHGTQIDFELTGKARPNPPAQDLQNLLGTAAAQVFGEGARVVVFSGQEDEGHQHGSNRHRTGLAADIRVYDASGTLVALSDPRAKEFALAAARLGARGIGSGSEYMGDAFHIDMVPHEDYSAGQGPVWGSFSTSMRDDLIAAMGEGTEVSMSDLLEIQDPLEREAAMDEYRLYTETAAAQHEAAIKAAGHQVFQHIESGGRLEDAPLELRQNLGREQMTALRAYARSKANGVPVVTDPEAYLELRQKMAEDSQGFRQLDLIPYVDRLSASDWQSFVDAQTKPINDVTRRAASTLMSMAKSALDGAGFDTRPNASDKKRREMAAFQSDLLHWQDQFITSNSRAPTLPEIDGQIGMMLMDVVLDPPGLRNKQDTSAFAIDLDGDPLDPNDDMPLEDFMDASIDINGVSVSDDMRDAIVGAFQRLYRRDPTPQEVFDELIKAPYFR